MLDGNRGSDGLHLRTRCHFAEELCQAKARALERLDRDVSAACWRMADLAEHPWRVDDGAVAPRHSSGLLETAKEIVSARDLERTFRVGGLL